MVHPEVFCQFVVGHGGGEGQSHDLVQAFGGTETRRTSTDNEDVDIAV
jgi:hypothetical protein